MKRRVLRKEKEREKKEQNKRDEMRKNEQKKKKKKIPYGFYRGLPTITFYDDYDDDYDGIAIPFRADGS